MNRPKKIFIIIAVIFILVIAAVSYDISRKTTFPGSEPQLKERLENQYLKDSAAGTTDTVRQP